MQDNRPKHTAENCEACADYMRRGPQFRKLMSRQRLDRKITRMFTRMENCTHEHTFIKITPAFMDDRGDWHDATRTRECSTCPKSMGWLS